MSYFSKDFLLGAATVQVNWEKTADDIRVNTVRLDVKRPEGVEIVTSTFKE
jgi:hypothetical protein